MDRATPLRVEKFSRKRQAILDAIRSTKCHPSAEWVYQSLKPAYPDLSLGTVYRNIARFKEQGQVAHIATVRGQERLDGNTAPHAHFICRTCGAVLDVDEMEWNAQLDQRVERALGARVDSHDLIFHGVCPECCKNREIPS